MSNIVVICDSIHGGKYNENDDINPFTQWYSHCKYYLPGLNVVILALQEYCVFA